MSNVIQLPRPSKDAIQADARLATYRLAVSLALEILTQNRLPNNVEIIALMRVLENLKSDEPPPMGDAA